MKVKRTISVDVEIFKVGDKIKFKLKDGEKVQAIAVKETPEGMLFVFKDCLAKQYPMFEDPGRMGSVQINYFNSDLRHALIGEILDHFPDEIRSRMVGMRIGNTDTFDLLRIPTEYEIFGENEYGQKEKGVKHWKPMEKKRNRIAFQGKEGAWEWYWLQNKIEDTASYFADVTGYGRADCRCASSSDGVRPVFLLSQNLSPLAGANGKIIEKEIDTMNQNDKTICSLFTASMDVGIGECACCRKVGPISCRT